MTKLFTILTDGSRRHLYFLTGKNPAGEQFLICPMSKAVVAVSFHPNGAPLGWKVRDLTEEFKKIKAAPDAREVHCVGTTKGSKRCDDLLSETGYLWAEELGITECPIHVQAFEIPEWTIAVVEYPAYLADYKERREHGIDEELEEALNCWESQKMFKLWVGRDYDMRADGTVEST